MTRDIREEGGDWGGGDPGPYLQEQRVTRSADSADADADTAAMRAEIRDTRARMGDTIEEIGERLNPRRIAQAVKEDVRDATIGRVQNMAQTTVDRLDDTGRSFAGMIRENPVPAALVGVGLGWLIWNTRQGGSSGAGSPGRYTGRSPAMATTPPGTMDRMRVRASEVGDDVKVQAGQLADRAQAAAGELSDRAQTAMSTATERTRVQARRVRDQFYENPVAAGAVALALGLAAGLAVPETRKEADLMGAARDALADKVRDVANETAPKLQHVAERVIEQVQTTARQAAQEEGLAST